MEAYIEEKGTYRERHVHIEVHIYGGTYIWRHIHVEAHA